VRNELQHPELSILLIDDDRGDAELLRRLLSDHSEARIEFVSFTTSSEALSELERRHVDIIFIDYLLGPETGLDALKKIRQLGITRPVIMLTGQGDEEIAVRAMKAGAADYLVKGRLSRDGLQHALMNVMEKAALHEKIEEQRMELERLASTDYLTGLWNRRHFMECLEESVSRATDEGTPLSLLLLDLDHFKRVNDTYGHAMGDEVLKASCELIQRMVPEDGIICRFGGEEICISLSGSGKGGARDFAEQVRWAVAHHTFGAPSGTKFRITCSIGIAYLDEKLQDVVSLVHEADERLYQAKAEGRNKVCG